MVITNIWCDIYLILFCYLASTFCRAIFHDPVVYPEPDVFKPERFINPDGSLREDPVLASVFGLGKRICPGRHLADATLFIAIASLLSVFDIKKNNGIVDGRPDMYPFTGDLLRCGHRVLLEVQQKLGELTTTLALAFRALSPAPSSQGIERQKSSSLPVPRHNDPKLSCYSFVLLLYLNKYPAPCILQPTLESR